MWATELHIAHIVVVRDVHSSSMEMGLVRCEISHRSEKRTNIFYNGVKVSQQTHFKPLRGSLEEKT